MGFLSRALGRFARMMTPEISTASFGRLPSYMPPKTILITGAAGSVASAIRPHLSPHFEHVILTDLIVPFDLLDNESFQQADLSDPSAMKMVCEGADAILHLGAASKNVPYEDLRKPNLDGVAYLFAAAREAGVGRVVFASSLHTHGFYRRHEWFDESSPPRPDTVYASSKLFGEAMAQLYAEKHGISAAVLRIGSLADTPMETEPGNWIGPSDLAELCRISLTHPEIRFEVFNGIADYKGSPIGRSRATKFGFQPSVCSESYKDALKRAQFYWKQGNSVDLRGAVFTGEDEGEAF